jgi:hypothetical protein
MISAAEPKVICGPMSETARKIRAASRMQAGCWEWIIEADVDIILRLNPGKMSSGGLPSVKASCAWGRTPRQDHASQPLAGHQIKERRHRRLPAAWKWWHRGPRSSERRWPNREKELALCRCPARVALSSSRDQPAPPDESTAPTAARPDRSRDGGPSIDAIGICNAGDRSHFV